MPKQDQMLKEKKDAAKQEVKIKAFKDKGFSEKDAIVKGLASMKRTVKEESKPSMVAPASPDMDEYPYGLKIRLEDDELEKLGIKELPEIGKNMKVTADAKVDSISSNESKGSGPKRCLELQITGMSVGEGADEKETD